MEYDGFHALWKLHFSRSRKIAKYGKVGFVSARLQRKQSFWDRMKPIEQQLNDHQEYMEDPPPFGTDGEDVGGLDFVSRKTGEPRLYRFQLCVCADRP